MKPLELHPLQSRHALQLSARQQGRRKSSSSRHDYDARGNPNKLPAGEKTRSGVSFYDVSDPAKPKELAFVPIAPDGKTHGLDIDDRYVYACAQYSNELNREGLQIIDYGDPESDQAGRHLACHGPAEGRAVRPAQPQRPRRQAADRPVPRDRSLQRPRLCGVARRRHGDPRRQGSHQPEAACHLRLRPPFHGGNLGAAHTSAPVVVRRGEHPDLVVHTDEIFDCPPGFGRILDVSDLKNPEVVKGERPANVVLLSTFRVRLRLRQFRSAEARLRLRRRRAGWPLGHDHAPAVVRPALAEPRLHHVVRRGRAGDGHLQSVRAGLHRPLLVAALSGSPGRNDRHTREIFQDPDTGLLYVTDGNGGGPDGAALYRADPREASDPWRTMTARTLAFGVLIAIVAMLRRRRIGA